MRHINFDPSSLTGEQESWFTNWQARATRATAEAQRAFNADSTVDFDSSIWRELKNWFATEFFDGRCAYCDGRYRTYDYGAAEHYRPKGEVKCTGGDESMTAVVDGNGEKHPGYYWLAYCWRNIVPACDRCNTGGKGTLFDVANDHIFKPMGGHSCSREVDQLNIAEEPLLLHPFDDEPTDHLVYGRFGVIAARDKSIRGASTIATCRLNREDLQGARQTLQDNLQSRLASVAHATAMSDDALLQDAIGEVLAVFVEGERAEFSECARQAIESFISRMRLEL